MTAPERAATSTPHRWLPLAAICLGSIMLLIDVSIVNVALPQMAVELGASFSAVQWVIDAYVLALAALLLGTGSLADRAGHRRTYLVGLTVFAAGSLACGLAPSVVALDCARAVQGVGAAAMLACTTALLNSTYRGPERGGAFGIWGAVSGAATAVGPILGGLLVQAASWRWIFIVNLPLSLLAVALTLRHIAPDTHRGPRRLDPAGVVTFTVFAGGLTYALIHAASHGWASTGTWALATFAGLAFASFLTLQTRKARTGADPMLDLSLFRQRAFTASMIASALSTLCAFAALTYSTIWLQTVKGLSPLQAGLTGLPLAAASFAVSMLAGRYLHRPPGATLATGMLLIGAGALLDAALLRGDASWPQLVPGTALTGLGAGLVLPTLTSAAMAAVPPQMGGMAAGALSTVRQLGFAIGIATFASIFTARAAAYLADGGEPTAGTLARGLAAGQAHNLMNTTADKHTLQLALERAALAGLDTIFLTAGILALIAAALVHFLTTRGLARRAGDARSPKPRKNVQGSMNT